MKPYFFSLNCTIFTTEEIHCFISVICRLKTVENNSDFSKPRK